MIHNKLDTITSYIWLIFNILDIKFNIFCLDLCFIQINEIYKLSPNRMDIPDHDYSERARISSLIAGVIPKYEISFVINIFLSRISSLIGGRRNWWIKEIGSCQPHRGILHQETTMMTKTMMMTATMNNYKGDGVYYYQNHFSARCKPIVRNCSPPTV